MELLNGLIGVLILFKEIAEWMADRPALCIAIFAVAVSLYSIHRSTRMAQYTYLANIWFKIKDEGFKRYDFIDPNKTTAYKTYFTGDMLMDYNNFAYMCWAHAEDIYLNRWHKKWWLWGTTCYTPTIRGYKKLHYKWLMEHTRDFNHHFRKYIEKLDLFSIDAEKFEKNLNNKKISADLKNEFKTEGFLLDNATITKIKKKEWEITKNFEKTPKTLFSTDKMHIKFVIRKEAKKLNLDKMRKFFAEKGDGELKIYNEFKDKK